MYKIKCSQLKLKLYAYQLNNIQDNSYMEVYNERCAVDNATVTSVQQLNTYNK